MRSGGSDAFELVESLRSELLELIVAWERELAAVRAVARPMAADLISKTSEFARRFECAAQDCCTAEARLGVPEEAIPADIDTLSARFDRLRAREIDDVRERYRAPLGRLARLRHGEFLEFDAIEAVRAEVADLERQIAAGPAPAGPSLQATFESRMSKVLAVLRFQEERESLVDEEWAEIEEAVARDWGKPLAVAIARGKLCVADAASGPPVLEPVPTATRMPADEAMPVEASTSIGADPATPMADASPSAPVNVAPGQPDPTVSTPDSPATPKDTLACDAERQLWALVEDGRLALALPIAEALARLGAGPETARLPIILEALLIGTRVASPHGPINERLRQLLSNLGEAGTDRATTGLSEDEWLLIAAAMLRPSLISPDCGAPGWLAAFEPSAGKAIFRYCQEIVAFGRLGLPLNASAIRIVLTEEAWAEEVKRLQERASAWLEQARAMTMVYAPATDVWRSWIRGGGVLHRLVAPVAENDSRRLPEIEREMRGLADPAQLRRQVDETDRKVLRRRRGNAIEARALTQLQSRAAEALDLVRRRIDLESARPDGDRDFEAQRTAMLRTRIEALNAEVLSEIDTRATDAGHSPRRRAVSAAFRNAMAGIRAIFDTTRPFPPGDPELEELRNGALTLLPSVAIADTGEPDLTDPREWLSAILEDLRAQATFSEVFAILQGRGDLDRCKQLLRHLRAEQVDDSLVTGLEGALETAAKAASAALAREIDEVEAKVEEAVVFGLIGDIDRGRLVGEIEAQRLASADRSFLGFRRSLSRLQAVRDELDRMRRDAARSARERLGGLEPPPVEQDRLRIETLLDAGDIHAANEYIDMLQRGVPLPMASEERDPFRAFFPEGLKRLDEDLARPSGPEDLVRAVRSAGAFGGLQFRSLSKPQAELGANTVSDWFAMKRTRKFDPRKLEGVLRWLGVPAPSVTSSGGGGERFSLSTTPLGDRDLCPIAQYGSQARGHYRLLCDWERPSIEDLLRKVDETVAEHPMIVLHFGRLTEGKRRELAEACRKRRRTFVLLDDALLAFLCAESGSRLRTFFECSLPFTSIDPFVTTASLVPPEMFYGRRRERDSVLEATGSCFIYGGRQLGKTALLREVHRRFDDPQGHRRAVWVDLRAEGIGHAHPAEEIWTVLGRQLAPVLGIAASTSKPDRLLRQIQEWLSRETERRLLVLLDEADRFLENDRGFNQSARLKGLMDATERRFKVVFAGLHNVQRTTRLANHPLAHLGEPICIGPLLEAGESREARDLIERPLRAIGYRFESPDLPTRILSQTNYYPSLVQLYCAQLLKHVSAPHARRFEPKTSPPYVITRQHVDEAYRSQDLRKSIHDRFLWTLQLDQRYEVIAHAIALGSLGPADGSTPASEGFTLGWIRKQAFDWWPEGFSDATSQEALQVLLDEMVGLGILRHTPQGHYALRSPNVVALMGSREEIEHALLRDREKPPEYEPAMQHTLLQEGSAHRRHPLSAEQEHAIWNRAAVSIVVGCAAAGLEHIVPALEVTSAARGGRCSRIHATDLATALRAVHALSEASREFPQLGVVDSQSPWTGEWVRAIHARSRAWRGRLRVVFVADPGSLWGLVREREPALGGGLDGVRTFSLEPWHDSFLRQWLDDIGLPVEPNARRELTSISGNWPEVLAMLAQGTDGDQRQFLQHRDALLKTFATEEGRRSFRSWWGLDLEQPAGCLRDLAILGEATVDELAAVSEAASKEEVELAVQWAEFLRLVSRPSGHAWKLCPVVARALGDGA